MSSCALVFIFSLVVWLVPDLSCATSVGPVTIEQPINLGAKSDPARIPLGRVGVICNYSYGLHRMIGEPRPCPNGAMRWEGGSELDQNLASIFGISVEPEDSTQIRPFPVTLRVKSWRPPGYSPYTKEQVLAATLWCLIRSVGGTPELPLVVQVVAEGADDKVLVEKYSGKYVTQPGEDQKEIPPVKVPGSAIEVDAKGIASVVFSEVTQKPTFRPLSPAMIILASGGDGDAGWYLLPVWGNGNQDDLPLKLCAMPTTICYSAWRTGGRVEANSFLADAGSYSFDVQQGNNGDSVDIRNPRVPQDTLAAEILALVITAQPTELRPLTISIRLEEYGLATYPAFRSAPGWQETRHDPHNIELKCEFVWDASARKLVKGSVPLVEINASIDFITMTSEQPLPPSAAKNLVALVRSRIQNGIHDGTLLAEKNMATDMLPDSGLRRQIGIAGYYEALATHCNESSIPDKTPEDPFKFGNPEFDQVRRMGWTIGMNRAQAIAIEARKEIDCSKVKNAE